MSLSALAPAIVGVLIVASVALFALLPFFRDRASAGGPPATAEAVAELDPAAQRFLLYRQVVELEFDQQTGKLSAEDCQELTAELLSRAAHLLRSDSDVHVEADVEAEIEEEIAAARRAFTGHLVAAMEGSP